MLGGTVLAFYDLISNYTFDNHYKPTICQGKPIYVTNHICIRGISGFLPPTLTHKNKIARISGSPMYCVTTIPGWTPTTLHTHRLLMMDPPHLLMCDSPSALTTLICRSTIHGRDSGSYPFTMRGSSSAVCAFSLCYKQVMQFY